MTTMLLFSRGHRFHSPTEPSSGYKLVRDIHQGDLIRADQFEPFGKMPPPTPGSKRPYWLNRRIEDEIKAMKNTELNLERQLVKAFEKIREEEIEEEGIQKRVEKLAKYFASAAKSHPKGYELFLKGAEETIRQGPRALPSSR